MRNAFILVLRRIVMFTLVRSYPTVVRLDLARAPFLRRPNLVAPIRPAALEIKRLLAFGHCLDKAHRYLEKFDHLARFRPDESAPRMTER